METKTLEVSVEQIWKIASRYAPALCRNFRIPESKYSPEDLVSDFIVKFIRFDFAEKYNPEVRSVQSYVYTGMRFMLVSQLRRKSRLTEAISIDQSIDHENADGESFTLEKLLPAKADDVSDAVISDVVSRIPETKFGYGHTVELFGTVYQSTVRDLVHLFLVGYTKEELAKLFKVTAARVGQLIKQALGDLPINFVTELA